MAKTILSATGVIIIDFAICRDISLLVHLYESTERAIGGTGIRVGIKDFF